MSSEINNNPNYLSLVPETQVTQKPGSLKPQSSSSTAQTHDTNSAVDDTLSADNAEADIMHSRTSSTTSSASSTGSVSGYLTLGTVHGGKHRDGEGDWSC